MHAGSVLACILRTQKRFPRALARSNEPRKRASKITAMHASSEKHEKHRLAPSSSAELQPRGAPKNNEKTMKKNVIFHVHGQKRTVHFHEQKSAKIDPDSEIRFALEKNESRAPGGFFEGKIKYSRVHTKKASSEKS